MSATAGPGPSTMEASLSPTVPTSARKWRINKRVINLVNPADPADFSCQSMSPSTSPNTSLDGRRRETTPDTRPEFDVVVQAYTPQPHGLEASGVRGILRPSGTPGSGNGVRFFPKNRFRIITPNQSLSQPTPAKPPPSPTTNSFLSQLLAVVPNMSPRRNPPPTAAPIPAKPDESWEVPGQEGEISLIGSSVASEHSMSESYRRGCDDEEDDEDEEDDGEGEVPREDSWNGQAEQHCSPLTLPAEASREVSVQELEMPSVEWKMSVPEDMSNLFEQRLSPTEGGSFSVSDISLIPPLSKPWIQAGTVTPARTVQDDTSLSLGPVVQDDRTQSITSFASPGQLSVDNNPTVRRQLSPLTMAERAILEPVTPTPAPGKPFSSIFADMSAEQADLSWPLNRQTAGEADEATVHSAIFSDLGAVPLADLPIVSPVRPSTETPKASGNITQFFDCESPSSPPAPALCSSTSSTITRSTPSSLAHVLLEPTKAVFDAHSAHSKALIAELQLYRSLAGKLQKEVTERDTLLADLNIRCLQDEGWRNKAEDLQTANAILRLGEHDRAMTAEEARRSASLSPSPSPNPAPLRHADHAGDRTTVEQSENRDLEIRLAKALADQEVLRKQLREMKAERDDKLFQLSEAKEAVRQAQERSKDGAVQARKRDEEQRSEIAHAQRETERLCSQLASARASENDLVLENDRVRVQMEELERHRREMREAKQGDEEEIRRLTSGLSKVSDRLKRAEGSNDRVEELEREVGAQKQALQGAEGRVAEEIHERTRLEGLVKELRHSLKVAQLAQSGASDTVSPSKVSSLEMEIHALRSESALLISPSKMSALQAEIHRLRSESASKDLEIVTLQKRKAELKDDREMLNIALDSKQQELELMKRKFSVRGIAGSTPLGPSKKINIDTPLSGSEIITPAPSKGAIGAHRRVSSRLSSSVFATSLVNAEHGRGRPALHPGTVVKSRVMRRVDEENHGSAKRGSMRRDRVLA